VEPAELLKLALQVSIMLTVFGFGLGATVGDVLYLVRHPRKLLISLVSMFIVMPFIALALVLVFDPLQVAHVALVALALSPVPPVLLTRQRKAGGRASYGLGLTAAVSILSIVLLPALVAFLGRIMDRPFVMGPAAVAGQVAVAVVLPLAVGMLVRAFPRLAQVLTFSIVAALAVYTLLGLAFGHILAGPDPGDSAVLALASAVRHPGIALAIAGANFPSLDVGAVIILYLLIGAVVCIPYMRWLQKRTAASPPAGRKERGCGRGPSPG
jgi:BASS family bile acid:Na+ symporter